MDVEDKVDLNAYGASSKDFDDILNIMLINLEKMFGLKDKDTLKRNLAVVINKVDIPTLEEKSVKPQLSSILQKMQNL